MLTPKERSGSWWLYWKKGGRAGKKQSTTWPDEAIALRAASLVKAHANNITDEEVYRQLLGEPEPDEPESSAPLLDEWMSTYLESKTNITPGTLGGYRGDNKNHILPVFGQKRMDEIKASHVGKWVNDFRTQGYKETSITRYFTLLSACFEAAMNERPPLVSENPCSLTDFERNQVAHDDDGEELHVYLTEAEFEILVQAFPLDYQVFMEWLVETGQRYSEATAIRVEDIIHPTRKSGPKVRVRRAWKRDPIKGPYLGTTKGRKQRRQPISGRLYAMILKLMKDQPGSALLFRTGTGGRLEYGNFYKNVWLPAVARAMRCSLHPPVDRGQQLAAGPRRRCRDFGGTREDGKPCGQWTKVGWTRCGDHLGPEPKAISSCHCEHRLTRRPTPHDMRHTCAAWLLSDGVSAVAVQRFLGHERQDTTTEIYGGLMPDVEDEIVQRLTQRRIAPMKSRRQSTRNAINELHPAQRRHAVRRFSRRAVSGRRLAATRS